ncbi:MAG: efflux RND transporter periplasmic adaptor subunit [Desulfovibrio sp.]
MPILLLGLLVAGCGGDDKGGKKDKAVPVVAARAEQRVLPSVIRAVGNLDPLATVDVRSRVGGMIQEQFVRDGQDVLEGDVLFQIDPRPFELAVQEARARLERDRAQLANAQSGLRRYAQLKKQQVVAEGQYDDSYAAAMTLEGTIKLDQATLDRALLDLEYATIRAPISGRVGNVLLNKGNIVEGNDDDPLVTINQIKPILVTFSVPEAHLPSIQGRMAQGSLAAQAFVQGDEARPEEGELYSVDNAVDRDTGSIRLKALFPNNEGRLWPGQFVRVVLHLGERGGVVVPSGAVLDGLKGTYVYVVKDDLTVEARPVKVVAVFDRVTLLGEGVSNGEIVVAEGQLRLEPGIKVVISGDPQPVPEVGP